MPSDACLRTHAFGRMLSCDLEHPPASGVSPPAPALARRRQALPSHQASPGVALALPSRQASPGVALALLGAHQQLGRGLLVFFSATRRARAEELCWVLAFDSERETIMTRELGSGI